MNSPQSGTATMSAGVLRARPPQAQTFRGNDPETVASTAICQDTPTKCQARTRLYRHGRLELEGFPVAEISDHLAEKDALVWLDLRDPDRSDLAVLSEEFGLHPLAVEDAVQEHQRPKLDRYQSHLFLNAYGARLDTGAGELATSEIAAFVTPRALITVRKDDGLDIGAVVERWDGSPDLAGSGVGGLLHGLLDYVVDGHFEAVQSLDDAVESLEDQLFSDVPQDFRVSLWQRGRNREDAIYRSKAVGEPPLMHGISVFHALIDAVAACGEGAVQLDAPATPERVLLAIAKRRAAGVTLADAAE